MTGVDKAKQHLKDLGAFDVPNPTTAKAIAMRRLLDEGYPDAVAQGFVEAAYRDGKGVNQLCIG